MPASYEHSTLTTTISRTKKMGTLLSGERAHACFAAGVSLAELPRRENNYTIHESALSRRRVR